MSTYTPTKYLTGAESAKIARAILAETFPGVKFSVRKSSGSALNVSWIDGPTERSVSENLCMLTGSVSDFTGDYRDPKPNATMAVFADYSDKVRNLVTKLAEGRESFGFLNDYVFTRRDISPEAEALAVQHIIDTRKVDPRDESGKLSTAYAPDSDLWCPSVHETACCTGYSWWEVAQRYLRDVAL